MFVIFRTKVKSISTESSQFTDQPGRKPAGLYEKPYLNATCPLFMDHGVAFADFASPGAENVLNAPSIFMPGTEFPRNSLAVRLPPIGVESMP